MNEVVESYGRWFSKTRKNLTCTKGSAAKEFLCRFQSLGSDVDTMIEGLRHSERLLGLSEEYAEERKNLRWLEKFETDCKHWKLVFETMLSVHGCSCDDVVDSLLEGKVSIEEAIDLVR